MSRRETFDSTTSFLDLLLSALGGVAVLVVLFAATLTRNADRQKKPPMNQLVFEVSGPGELRLAHEIQMSISNGSDVVIFPDEQKSGDFRVEWQKAPSRLYYAKVGAPSGTELTIRAWLARLDDGSQTRPAPARLVALKPTLQGNGKIELKVRWASQLAEAGKKIVLKRSSSFSGEGVILR